MGGVAVPAMLQQPRPLSLLPQTSAIWSPRGHCSAHDLLLCPDCKIQKLLHSTGQGLPAAFGTVAYSFPEKLSLNFWPAVLPLVPPPTSPVKLLPRLFHAVVFFSRPQSQGLLFRGVLRVLFSVCSQQSLHRENAVLAHKSSEV